MRILIVKLSSLGDVVQATPVVADLLAHFPDATVDWVAEEAFVPLLGRVKGLNDVIPIALRRWRRERFGNGTSAERRAMRERLQAHAYDAVLDVQGLIKSALVARLARVTPGGFKATFGNGSESCGWEWPVRFMLDLPVPMDRRIHAVQRYRQLAARAFRYTVSDKPTYAFRTEPVAHVNTVMLVHGTTRPDNEWPIAQWVDLATRLAGTGLRVALPHADAAEEVRAHAIAQQLNAQRPGTAEVWPRMRLPELLDNMAGCAGVIGVDTGLSHMAVALDLKHVQIFSHPRAFRAGPLPSDHQLSAGGEGPPDVVEVWQAWQRVAAAGASSARTAEATQ